MSRDRDATDTLKSIDSTLLRIAHALEAPQRNGGHKVCSMCGCTIVLYSDKLCPVCSSAFFRP